MMFKNVHETIRDLVPTSHTGSLSTPQLFYPNIEDEPSALIKEAGRGNSAFSIELNTPLSTHPITNRTHIQLKAQLSESIANWTPKGIHKQKARPKELLKQLVLSAKEEIIILSNNLDTSVYDDKLLLSAFKKAAENDVNIWIIVRQKCDWNWLDKHPLGKYMREFEEEKVFIRTLNGIHESGKPCDIATFDNKFFRIELDYETPSAIAGYCPNVGPILRDFLVDLIKHKTTNLRGDIKKEIELTFHPEKKGGHYTSDEYPGVFIAKDKNGDVNIDYVERITSLIVGADHGRINMKYKIRKLIDAKKIILTLENQGMPATNPK